MSNIASIASKLAKFQLNDADNFEKRLFKLKRLYDLLTRLLNYGPSLDVQKREQLHNVFIIIKQLLFITEKNGKKDYNPLNVNNIPVNSANINAEIGYVIQWFKEDVASIYAHPHLQYYYKKVGCDLFYGKKIEEIGNPTVVNSNIKGPAIIATSHHFDLDNCIIQAVVPYHITWIGDPRGWSKKENIDSLGNFNSKSSRRWDYGFGFMRRILNLIDIIEVNRDSEMSKGKSIASAVKKLEQKKIIGIMPLGGMLVEFGISTDNMNNMQATEFALKHNERNGLKIAQPGVFMIAQLAQKRLNTRIPIYTVGTKLENQKYFINWGSIQHVEQNESIEQLEEKNKKLVMYLEELAK